MRKALIVGIDYYETAPSLSGCVNDAHAVSAALERHADGTVNFVTPRMLTGTGPAEKVNKGQLKNAVRELFGSEAEIALLYFSGHGYIEDTGGFLCGTDTETGDDGLALGEVMSLANDSPAKNRVVILDSCHSGIAAARPGDQRTAEIKEGMTLLTASAPEQYAYETPGGGSGVFTNLLLDALNGAAANLVGDVTPGSVYAHIDQSLGPWAQRPMFKTNIRGFVSLRKAAPPIPLADLLAIATHFPYAGYKLQLDPSYEPERSAEQRNDPNIPPPDPTNTAIFAALQKYVKVNLVRPVGAPHMWHAAMQSQSCELTVLGEHYRNLVAKKLI